MDLAAVVVTLIAATTFFVAAAMKLAGHPKSLRTRDRLGLAPQQWRAIGGLEILGAAGALIGLAYPPLGIAALLGLTLLSFGALGFHLTKRDPLIEAAPAVLAVIASTAALALQVAAA